MPKSNPSGATVNKKLLIKSLLKITKNKNFIVKI